MYRLTLYASGKIQNLYTIDKPERRRWCEQKKQVSPLGKHFWVLGTKNPSRKNTVFVISRFCIFTFQIIANGTRIVYLITLAGIDFYQ